MTGQTSHQQQGPLEPPAGQNQKTVLQHDQQCQPCDEDSLRHVSMTTSMVHDAKGEQMFPRFELKPSIFSIQSFVCVTVYDASECLAVLERLLFSGSIVRVRITSFYLRIIIVANLSFSKLLPSTTYQPVISRHQPIKCIPNSVKTRKKEKKGKSILGSLNTENRKYVSWLQFFFYLHSSQTGIINIPFMWKNWNKSNATKIREREK